ncbi:helix-turn-helix domain-containing protein [Streptomyces sp. N2A]|uniref:helix-turn-helix domain-containing protein n=1 Tax=Streptomyces sp. N2A TaxID=3073936 RepID=UPI00287094C0|nr:helix-turn-helix domain-containing protein [Streptomyces sp. N2A]
MTTVAPATNTVALAVTDGVRHFELAAPCEVFGVDWSGIADPWYELTVCGPAGARVGGHFRLEPDRGLDRLPDARTVIVPAYAHIDEEPPGELIDAIRAAHQAGARVVSLCTGAFVLAAAGLLDGRRATTHWAHAKALATRYPAVHVDPDVLYVDDGDVLTSAGKAAAMDLCLHLVRLDHGSAIANAVARNLVVPPHRPGGQAQFVTTPLPDPRPHPLAALFPWVLARLDQPLTVQDLARQANMSPRNLARHFHAVTGTTPLRWLHTQRIHRAQELLENSDDSIDAIATVTGMGTAASLRRHFNRTLGVPPDTYRRTFRQRHDTAGGGVPTPFHRGTATDALPPSSASPSGQRLVSRPSSGAGTRSESRASTRTRP